jgi:hypothetical protein
MIRHRLDYVEALALDSSIVCITESHLDDTILSRDIQIQGYHEHILRKDRNCFADIKTGSNKVPLPVF